MCDTVANITLCLGVLLHCKFLVLQRFNYSLLHSPKLLVMQQQKYCLTTQSLAVKETVVHCHPFL